MITKDSVVEAYMINDKRVVAEMLYDTVMSYEEKLKDAEWRLELALAQLESIEDRTCERDAIFCNQETLVR